MQTDLFETHANENNPASQQHLDENRTHFNKQCGKIYGLLMDGEVLSVKEAIVKHNVHSLPRRILDLKKKKVSISEKWEKNLKPPIKYWFMSMEDKLNNREKFK